jgi:hypothetical protein
MRSKEIIASIAVVGAVATFALFNINANTSSSNFLGGIDKYEMDFNNYVLSHRRTIGTKEEYEFRRSIYIKNAKYIEDHNTNKAEAEGYYLEINHLMDITVDEWTMMKGYKKATSNADSPVQKTKCHGGDATKASWDWRTEAGNPNKIIAVSNVKN